MQIKIEKLRKACSLIDFAVDVQITRTVSFKIKYTICKLKFVTQTSDFGNYKNLCCEVAKIIWRRCNIFWEKTKWFVLCPNWSVRNTIFSVYRTTLYSFSFIKCHSSRERKFFPQSLKCRLILKFLYFIFRFNRHQQWMTTLYFYWDSKYNIQFHFLLPQHLLRCKFQSVVV